MDEEQLKNLDIDTITTTYTGNGITINPNGELILKCFSRDIDIYKDILDVIFQEDKGTTVVKWKDGTVTVVSCCEGDSYNKEFGLLACIVKKIGGNTGGYNNVVKHWLENKERKRKEKEKKLAKKRESKLTYKTALDEFDREYAKRLKKEQQVQISVQKEAYKQAILELKEEGLLDA